MNLSQIVWDSALVEEWLEIAAKVDRVLLCPGPRMARPRLVLPIDFTSLIWDEISDDKPNSKFQPTNEQVSMWEEVVLRWLPLVSDDVDKKILWLRACGFSWLRIAEKTKIERHLASSYYKSALASLAKALIIYYKNPRNPNG